MIKQKEILGAIIHNSADLDIDSVNALLTKNNIDAEVYTKAKDRKENPNSHCAFSCRNYTNKPFVCVLSDLLNVNVKEMYWVDNRHTMRIIFD